MATLAAKAELFLAQPRIAVAGVSRTCMRWIRRASGRLAA